MNKELTELFRKKLENYEPVMYGTYGEPYYTAEDYASIQKERAQWRQMSGANPNGYVGNLLPRDTNTDAGITRSMTKMGLAPALTFANLYKYVAEEKAYYITFDIDAIKAVEENKPFKGNSVTVYKMVKDTAKDGIGVKVTEKMNIGISDLISNYRDKLPRLTLGKRAYQAKAKFDNVHAQEVEEFQF